MCWHYLIVFILSLVVFVCDWDTWYPLKNWTPVGNFWMLLLGGQVFNLYTAWSLMGIYVHMESWSYLMVYTDVKQYQHR